MDDDFMEAARLAATHATCPQRQVGTVIVKDGRIIATGFNASPPEFPLCTEVGCLILPDRGTSCQRVLHAECNAIMQDSRNLEGATLYTSFFPCLRCILLIISAKIREVVYENEHEHEGKEDEYEKVKREFIQRSGITFRRYSS